MISFKEKLIASCGLNCGICLHYLRPSNKCPGCFSGRIVNGKYIKCAIKICKNRSGEYCFNCNRYPCERLKRLDKRYREKYGISAVENLGLIKEIGISRFIDSEGKKWINRDGIYCVHDKKRY